MLDVSLKNKTDFYVCYGGYTWALSDIHQELCIFVRARQYHKALSAKLSPSGATDKNLGGGQTKPEVLETRNDGGKHGKIAIFASKKQHETQKRRDCKDARLIPIASLPWLHIIC